MTADRKSHNTGPLIEAHGRTITVPSFSTVSLMTPEDVSYNPVPYNYEQFDTRLMWRIYLRFGASASHSVVGLDIYSDVVFGRGAGRPTSPDVDLNQLDALKLGVSRRHAMLRPTSRNLYLIDLDSTNGTFVNAVPVGRGMAQVLRTRDTVAMGGLSFEIQIIKQPDNGVKSAPRSVKAEASTKSKLKQGDGPETLPPNKVISPLYRKQQSSKLEKGTQDFNS